MEKRVVIVTNGRLYKEILNDIRKDDFVIGVDRAAYWLITHGVVPDVAVGDFDSTSKEEFTRIKKSVLRVYEQPPHPKYHTDTELALRHSFTLHPTSIVIVGGTGTRLDHTMGTLQLLELAAARGIPTEFRDETNYVVLVSRGRTILVKRKGYRYVSVIPVTESIQITLLKFKYEVMKKTIRRGQTVGISNEFMGSKAEVIVYRGRALIIQSRD